MILGKCSKQKKRKCISPHFTQQLYSSKILYVSKLREKYSTLQSDMESGSVVDSLFSAGMAGVLWGRNIHSHVSSRTAPVGPLLWVSEDL